MVGGHGSSNIKHLLQLWARPVLLIAAMLAAAVFTLVRGSDATPVYWGIGVYGFTYALFRVLRSRARVRLARLLLEPSPDGLLTATRQMFSRARTPHANLLLATSLSAQRALYGQFGRALDELDQHDWNGVPAMYRASMLQTRALVHYLSRDDVAAGLRASEQAEALAAMPRFVPGSARARRGTAVNLQIGRVLSEGATPELAAALDRAAVESDQPIDRAVRAWGAALAYTGLGDEQNAARWRARVVELAPHCAPLHRTDPREHAVPGEIAARAVDAPEAARAAMADGRSCALHPGLVADVCCIRCGSFACARCARAVSEQASICAACTERYRDLRSQHLDRERWLRAAGLLGQLGAVSLGLVFALAIGVTAIADGLLLYSVIQLGFACVMLSFIWRRGGRIRRLQGNWRSELYISTLPMILLVPVGSAFAGRLLWLIRNAPFDAERVADYERAIAVTPEFAPKNPWPVALGAWVALLLNFVLVIWVIASRR